MFLHSWICCRALFFFAEFFCGADVESRSRASSFGQTLGDGLTLNRNGTI
jgi:hypothetical protein